MGIRSFVSGPRGRNDVFSIAKWLNKSIILRRFGEVHDCPPAGMKVNNAKTVWPSKYSSLQRLSRILVFVRVFWEIVRMFPKEDERVVVRSDGDVDDVPPVKAGEV